MLLWSYTRHVLCFRNEKHDKHNTFTAAVSKIKIILDIIRTVPDLKLDKNLTT